MSRPKRSVFRDLPATAFPITVTYLDDATGEPLRQDVITGPGALQVPGFMPRRVRVRLECADGEVLEAGPDGP